MKIGNLLLFVLLFLGLDATAINSTKIQGRVFEATDQKITFSETNIITKEVLKKSLFIGEGGYFSVTLDNIQESAGVVTLSYKDFDIPVFYESGQNIFIQFNGELGLSSVRYSGDGATNNLYLLKSKSKFLELEKSVDQKIKEGSSNTFKVLVHKIHSEKNQYYLNFKRKLGDFTDAFDSYARAEINYWKALKLLEYRWRKSIFSNKAGNVNLTSSYFFFLDDIKINNEKAIISEVYQDFLIEYLRYLYEKKVKEGTVVEEIKSLTVTGHMISLRTSPSTDNFNLDGSDTRTISIEKGQKVQFLKRSNFVSELPINGELVTHPWFLVKMKNQKMGWIYGGRVEPSQDYFDFKNSCFYTMAKENLTGKAKEFILVSEIYNELKNNPSESNSKIAKEYVAESRNDAYNELLLLAMGSGRVSSGTAKAPAPVKNEQTKRLDGEIESINDQLEELELTQKKMQDLQLKLKAEQDKKERMRKIAEIQARIDAEEAENEEYRKIQEEKEKKARELRELLEAEKENMRKADERFKQQSSKSSPTPKAESSPIEATTKPEEPIIVETIKRESTKVEVPEASPEVVIEKKQPNPPPVVETQKTIEVAKISPTPPKTQEVVEVKKKAQKRLVVA